MKLRNIYTLAFLLILSGFLFLGTGCGKDNPVDKLIPAVRVNFSIDPNSIQYDHLNIAGNYAYVTGGYRGIIIFNAGFGTFKAYERTSPVDFPNDYDCRVSVDDSGVIAVDPCSDSKYSLMDGNPFGGPAVLPLKQYRAEFDGAYLHIFN